MAWVADALVLLGLAVMTVGVVGLFRMPDVFLQLHAASKAVFLGVIVFALASVATLEAEVISRAALIAAFLVLTTPVAAHAIARAAHLTGEGDAGRPAGPPGDEPSAPQGAGGSSAQPPEVGTTSTERA